MTVRCFNPGTGPVRATADGKVIPGLGWGDADDDIAAAHIATGVLVKASQGAASPGAVPKEDPPKDAA